MIAGAYTECAATRSPKCLASPIAANKVQGVAQEYCGTVLTPGCTCRPDHPLQLNLGLQ